MRKKTKTTRRGRPGNLTMQFAARLMAMTQGLSDNHARALLRDEGKGHLSPGNWYIVARALEVGGIETVEDFTEALKHLGIGVGWKG